MNTANQTTSTNGSESCNTMGGGGQGATRGSDVTREPWWVELGHLVDDFEAELAAAIKTGANSAH